ncbi:hypothetical protein ACWJJH_21350 [Endozoicomonadaceae bacterium StTr2]
MFNFSEKYGVDKEEGAEDNSAAPEDRATAWWGSRVAKGIRL